MYMNVLESIFVTSKKIWGNIFIPLYKGPFTQAIFAAIFLLLMHAIKWIDNYECIRPSVQSYINQYFCDSIACVRMRKIARVNEQLTFANNFILPKTAILIQIVPTAVRLSNSLVDTL